MCRHQSQHRRAANNLAMVRLFLATGHSLRPFSPRFATVTPLRPVKHAMVPYLLAMVVSLVCVVLVRCLQSLAQLLER